MMSRPPRWDVAGTLWRLFDLSVAVGLMAIVGCTIGSIILVELGHNRNEVRPLYHWAVFGVFSTILMVGLTYLTASTLQQLWRRHHPPPQ